MIAEEDALELSLTRRLRAPPPIVFQALTEPAEVAKWWGPQGFTTPDLDFHARVGGSYRIAMLPPDGELFYLAGEFREVDPPALLVYTFRWEAPTPDDRETVVTLSLRRVGDETELDLTQRSFATAERRALHHGGWSDSLDKLQALVSESS